MRSIGQKIIFQLLLGVDTLSALYIHLAVQALFVPMSSFFSLGVALFFGYGPDLDTIPFLMFRRKLRLLGHWVVGHYPLPVIIMAGGLGAWLGMTFEPSHAPMFALLALACTTAHFVHDSVQPQGLPWLWPVSLVRITFKRGLPEVADPKDFEAMQEKLERNLTDHNTVDEVSSRLETASSAQLVLRVSLFMIAVIVEVYFWLL